MPKTKRKPKTGKGEVIAFMDNKGTPGKAFKRLFEESDRRLEEQKKRAGKHKCKWIKSGSVSQVTSGDKILKRPLVLARFLECKLCGGIKMAPVPKRK